MNQKELNEFVSSHQMLIGLMFDEINSQVKRAKLAADKIDNFLHQEFGKRNSDELWTNLQIIMESGSAISRILKPAPHSKREKEARALTKNRGKALRTLLDIDNAHPMLARNLRNRLIHLDEDIDDWWLQSKYHIISRKSISDQDLKNNGIIEDHEIFEHFNWKSGDFIYRGERYSIFELLDAINDVHHKIYRAVQENRNNHGSFGLKVKKPIGLP